MFHANRGTAVILGYSIGDAPDDLVKSARVGCVGVIPHEASCDEAIVILKRALRG